MLFVVIDVTSSSPNVLNFFGVSGSNIPTARIINTDTGKKYSISGEVTGESLREFSRGVVEGTAEVTHTFHILSHNNITATDSDIQDSNISGGRIAQLLYKYY